MKTADLQAVRLGFTVEEQEKNERSVLNFYRKLLRLRATDECLKDGAFELLKNDGDEVSVYSRSANGKTVYVVSNFADTVAPMPDIIPSDAESILNNYDSVDDMLKPYQSVWFKK